MSGPVSPDPRTGSSYAREWTAVHARYAGKPVQQFRDEAAKAWPKAKIRQLITELDKQGLLGYCADSGDWIVLPERAQVRS